MTRLDTNPRPESSSSEAIQSQNPARGRLGRRLRRAGVATLAAAAVALFSWGAPQADFVGDLTAAPLFSKTVEAKSAPPSAGAPASVSAGSVVIEETNTLELLTPEEAEAKRIAEEKAAAEAEAAAYQAKLDAVTDEALAHEGTPYVYAGMAPGGFDCSGFVGYVYATAHGIELPRTAAGQSGVGADVSLDELQAGDLLFWGSGAGVYHSGLALGDGRYIHAAGYGQGVVIDDLTNFPPSFAKRIL